MDLISDIWNEISDKVVEKNKVDVLKSIMLVALDHASITEANLKELVHDGDKYIEEAVTSIFKDDEMEEDEDEYDVSDLF